VFDDTTFSLDIQLDECIIKSIQTQDTL
jgi:hypothetical protein